MKTEYVLGHSAGGFHKMAVHVWGEAKSGGVPLVCVHGLTRNGRDFDELAKRISPSRAVYCPDIVGRGQSDNLADPLGYTFTQYIADMTALIARTGAAQIDWVGTSMGGLLGIMLAAQPQTPIRRLVINDVGPVIPKESLIRIGEYLSAGFPSFADVAEVEAHMRKIYAPFGPLSDQNWRNMAAHGTRKDAQGRLVMAYDFGLAEAYKAIGNDINLWDVYDKITAPTLLIRGAQSDLLTKEIAQEMTGRGPRARLVEIEGAGHAPALMNDEQTKRIEDFLNG